MIKIIELSTNKIIRVNNMSNAVSVLKNYYKINYMECKVPMCLLIYTIILNNGDEFTDTVENLIKKFK